MPAAIQAAGFVLGMHLLPRPPYGLDLNCLRYDNHAVYVRNDQIPGTKPHSVDLDRYVDIDDALPVLAVVDAGSAREHGKLHLPHLTDVAHLAVNDRATQPPLRAAVLNSSPQTPDALNPQRRQ